LTVHLDYPQCFDAEVYADDVGIVTGKAEFIRAQHYMRQRVELIGGVCFAVNLGEIVLRSLFEHWFIARREPYFSDGDFLKHLPPESTDTKNDNSSESDAADQQNPNPPEQGSRSLPMDVAKQQAAQNVRYCRFHLEICVLTGKMDIGKAEKGS